MSVHFFSNKCTDTNFAWARQDRQLKGEELIVSRTKDVDMSLVWKPSKPAPDPFEAVAGDQTEYQVHSAESAALDLPGIEAAIIEVVKKALGLSGSNSGKRCKRVLFLWDVVYATLTVVYTDDSMMYDARHVTKCYFAELDKEGKAKKLSSEIRQMIESSIAQSRHGLIPATMPIFYSDQDRASVGAAEFKAQPLTNG